MENPRFISFIIIDGPLALTEICASQALRLPRRPVALRPQAKAMNRKSQHQQSSTKARARCALTKCTTSTWPAAHGHARAAPPTVGAHAAGRIRRAAQPRVAWSRCLPSSTVVDLLSSIVSAAQSPDKGFVPR
jgi:hypothetical protein